MKLSIHELFFHRVKILFTLILFVLTFASCSSNADEKIALFQTMEKMAQAGNAEAQYHVGMMLNNGIGTTKNPAQAYEYFRKSADSSDPLGAYKLGCYYAGQFENVVPVNEEKALEYKLISANAGYSLAQHDVGTMYFKKNNHSEAIRYWQLAAQQGYVEALYNLAVVYREGKVIPANHILAYKNFKIANLIAKGSLSESAKSTLDGFKKLMSPSDISQAEKMVTEWKPNRMPLTEKAAAGLNRAVELTQNQ